jgi:DNA-binding IscR family transcriptional regulator
MGKENDQVDEKILSKLGKHPVRCGLLIDATLIDMRVVDRALQRLRKAGKIKFVRGPDGGWVRK